MSLPQSQKRALELAAQILPQDAPGYLVGGFVRDALLGRDSADIDLALAGEPSVALEMARRLANACHRELPDFRVRPFSLDQDFGVARVVFTPYDTALPEDRAFYFDFAVFNGGNLETDLARRDFTINALALPLQKFLVAGEVFRLEDIVAVSSGRTDLTQKFIRAVSEKNLVDDPLRMLRGIRLRAQLSSKQISWQFAPGTLELFQKLHPLIRQSASERVRDELNKTWIAGNVAYSLRLLQQSGLYSSLLPELAPATFEVTTGLANRLEWLLTSPEEFYGEIEADLTHPERVIRYWPEVLARLKANGGERVVLLYWAALFYYFAENLLLKSEDLEEDPETGLEPLRQILIRLRSSRETIDRLLLVFKQQPWLSELAEQFDPVTGSGITNREAYRFLKDCGPVPLEVLLLGLAAYNGPDWAGQLTLVDFLTRKLLGDDAERVMEKPRLIDGTQLVKALATRPGPKIGLLLREIEEAQAEGEIETTEEAIELARRLLAAEDGI
jgi:poly(A) polymerase/tRNA nucleotidyltransferase (CCA-adding enzyme)